MRKSTRDPNSFTPAELWWLRVAALIASLGLLGIVLPLFGLQLRQLDQIQQFGSWAGVMMLVPAALIAGAVTVRRFFPKVFTIAWIACLFLLATAVALPFILDANNKGSSLPGHRMPVAIEDLPEEFQPDHHHAAKVNLEPVNPRISPDARSRRSGRHDHPSIEDQFSASQIVTITFTPALTEDDRKRLHTAIKDHLAGLSPHITSRTRNSESTVISAAPIENVHTFSQAVLETLGYTPEFPSAQHITVRNE